MRDTLNLIEAQYKKTRWTTKLSSIYNNRDMRDAKSRTQR